MKEIPGLPYWRAGEDGYIYCEIDGRWVRKREVIQFGYRMVRRTWSDHGKKKKQGYGVGPLICLAFHGPKPEGHECLHGPGGKLDCTPGNVRWGTRAENNRDKVLAGTAGQHRKWMTIEKVAEIKKDYAELKSIPKVATKHGYTISHIWKIVTGRAGNRTK